MSSRQDAAWLREINRFLKTTQSGDKAELSTVPENAPVWNLVTSTRDNCLGSDCAYYKDCFVMRARKEAQQADVVVVNHHLFFADVMLKDTGMAELLPAAKLEGVQPDCGDYYMVALLEQQGQLDDGAPLDHAAIQRGVDNANGVIAEQRRAPHAAATLAKLRRHRVDPLGNREAPFR